MSRNNRISHAKSTLHDKVKSNQREAEKFLADVDPYNNKNYSTVNDSNLVEGQDKKHLLKLQSRA